MLERLTIDTQLETKERDPRAGVHREPTVFSSDHGGGRIGVEEPLHAEPTHDTTAHVLGERGQIGLGDRPGRQERRRPATGWHEDAVGRARMEMHMVIERRSEAVQKGDGAESRASRARPVTITGRARRADAAPHTGATRDVVHVDTSPDLAAELSRRYWADNCPYDVVAREDGWLLRLRPEFVPFGSVLEQRTRTARLDAESLDVLAVVAWSQPVPRDKLVELGRDARPAVLRQLVRRSLLELRHPPAGDDEPPTYHTTVKFLEVSRLEWLDDLRDPAAPPT